MDSQCLSSLQRLFLWTLRHWGAEEGPAPHMLRTLRASPAGPTLPGAADRLLSWHDRYGRGPRHLGVLQRNPYDLRGTCRGAPLRPAISKSALRLWLADLHHGRADSGPKGASAPWRTPLRTLASMPSTPDNSAVRALRVLHLRGRCRAANKSYIDLSGSFIGHWRKPRGAKSGGNLLLFPQNAPSLRLHGLACGRRSIPKSGAVPIPQDVKILLEP